jgi:TP901 family phage tail tape measure protein
MASSIVEIVYRLIDKVSPEAKKVSKSLDGIDSSGKKAAKSQDDVESSQKKLSASSIALGGALAFISAKLIGVAKESLSLETKVVNVGNLFGATDEQIQGMTDSIVDMSAKTGKTWDDLSDSLFDIVSAGIPAGEAMEFLAASADLAKAGVTSTRVAADGLTSVMNAYGKSADDVTDISNVFFAAQVKGKTTIEALSGAIGRIAPIAASLGVDFESVSAALAAMTAQGINTNEATTSLRQTLSAILKPSEQAKELARDLGLEFNSQALEARGLDGFLKDVIETTGGNSEAMGMLFGSVEAVNAVLALSKNDFKNLDEAMIATKNTTNETADALDRISNTKANQIAVLGQTIKSLVLPPIQAVAEEINFIASGLLKIVNFAKDFGDRLFVSKSEQSEILKGIERKNKAEKLGLTLSELDAKEKAAALEVSKEQKVVEEKISDIKRKRSSEVQEKINAMSVSNGGEKKDADQREIDREAAKNLKIKEDAERLFLEKDAQEIERKRALNQITLDEEIAHNERLLEQENLTQNAIDAIKKRGYDLETKRLVDLNKKDLELQDMTLEQFKLLGDYKVSLQEAVSNGILEFYKKEALAAIDIEAGKLFQMGMGKLMASMFTDPLGYASIAAAAAITAGARSVISPIKLAEGGIVMPQSGGVQATIAEAGKPEIVMPLDDPRAAGMMGSSGGREVIILSSDGQTMLAKGIYAEQQDLMRTGQIGRSII